MRKGFKQWAEKEALLRRQQAELSSDSALPARRLAEILQVPVLQPHEIGLDDSVMKILLRGEKSKWSAVTVYPNGIPLVLYNPSHSDVRQEADLMHEFSHIICKHPAGKVMLGGSLPIALREYNKEHEDEADWLAATLKVPRQAMMAMIRRGCSTEDLALHFECSIPLARMRRNRTGIDKHLARLHAYSGR